MRLAVFLLLCLSTVLAWAGPPFQTDDPEPVPFRQYEAYAFSTWDRAPDSTVIQAPAFEFNVGAAPNLQLHVIVPATYASSTGAPSAYGLGDIEVGAKYRFIQEKNGHPQVGTFPLIELPSGDSSRGLGNGQVWARLPLWIQKSSGPWTTYGGLGYNLNTAPGMNSAPYGGWLVQRDLNKRWTLGGEIYGQGALTKGGRSATFLDGGGYYHITEGWQALFMLGHTFAGENHLVGYVGLYYTWGPKQQGGGQDTHSLLPRALIQRSRSLARAL